MAEDMTSAVGAVDGRRASHPYTGIGKYVARLATMLPFEMGDSAPEFLAGKWLQITRSSDRRDVLGRMGKFTWEQIGLPQHVKRRAPAFLHYPYYETALVGTSVPTCVTVTDLDTLINPGRYSIRQRAYYNTCLRRSVSYADVVIAISQTTADDLIRHLGVKPGKIRVVYLGVDEVFKPAPATMLSSSTCDHLPRPWILVGGGVGIRKNFAQVKRVLPRVARDLNGATVFTTGAGLGGEPRLTVTEKLWHQHTGILSQEALGALYASVDVTVCPSLYEGFGFSVVEAMASGSPVIASAAGSHPEIGGTACMYFEAGSDAAFEESVTTVLNRSETRAAMSAAGIEHAKSFSWRHTVASTAKIYRSLTQ